MFIFFSFSFFLGDDIRWESGPIGDGVRKNFSEPMGPPFSISFSHARGPVRLGSIRRVEPTERERRLTVRPAECPIRRRPRRVVRLIDIGPAGLKRAKNRDGLYIGLYKRSGSSMSVA